MYSHRSTLDLALGTHFRRRPPSRLCHLATYIFAYDVRKAARRTRKRRTRLSPPTCLLIRVCISICTDQQDPLLSLEGQPSMSSASLEETSAAPTPRPTLILSMAVSFSKDADLRSVKKKQGATYVSVRMAARGQPWVKGRADANAFALSPSNFVYSNTPHHHQCGARSALTSPGCPGKGAYW